MKPYQFHREADAEFTEALRHYAGISPELGARFYDEVEAAIADARASATLPHDRTTGEAAFVVELPLRAALPG